MRKEDTGGTSKRLCFKSFPLKWYIVSQFLVIGGIMTGVDFVLKGWFMEFSISDHAWGIKSLQEGCPLWLYSLLRLQTQFGGGFELLACMVLALVFLPRSRFFYYMVVSMMANVVVLQMRLTFADPRPFHLDAKITPWKCFVTYGNPSDHALCSILVVFVVMCDLFHGVPITFSYAGDSIYHGWCFYLLMWIIALWWALLTPFSRYLGGVQSLDQILFGWALGGLLGFFSHFVVRDPLIWFFEKIIAWQAESKGLLNFGKGGNERTKRGEMLDVTEIGLDDALEYTLQGQAEKFTSDDDEDHAEFRPYTFLICCFLFWLAAIGGATVAYVLDTQRLDKDSEEIKKWVANMDHQGCPKYIHNKSFHNKMFMEAAIITFHLSSMAIFTQRKRIGIQCCYDYTIQDGNTIRIKMGQAMAQLLIRALVFATLFSFYVFATKTGLALKGEPSNSVGNQFAAMFEVVIIPMLIIAYLLNSGIYDLLVMCIQKCALPAEE